MTKTTVTILMIRYFPHVKIPSFLSYNLGEKIVCNFGKLYTFKIIFYCALCHSAKSKDNESKMEAEVQLKHEIYTYIYKYNYTFSARELGLIPVLGRSPGEENGNPLQYSSLENSMDRGSHGVVRVGPY